MDKKYIESGLTGLIGEVALIDHQLSDLEFLSIRREKLSDKQTSLIKKINMVKMYREDQISDKSTYEEKLFKEIDKCGIDSVSTRIPWFNKTIEALGRQLEDLRNELDDITGRISNLDNYLSHKQRLIEKRAKIIADIKVIYKEMNELKQNSNTQESEEPTA